jgi:hypothetical protein
MKTIEPVVFPLNLGTATILNAYCINDNLNNAATFYYSLLSDTQSKLQEGNLTMTGEDYNGWATNEYAYNWVATQIDVTITGDYVPPAPPIVEEPNVEEEVVAVPPAESIIAETKTAK